MIGRLALRSLTAHPVRSAVLAAGFGVGVAVMAILLGVAGIVLEQAQSPALVGGGDVNIRLSLAVPARLRACRERCSPMRFVREFAPRPPRTRPICSCSTTARPRGSRLAVAFRASSASSGDPEVAGMDAWRDTPEDDAWTRRNARDACCDRSIGSTPCPTSPSGRTRGPSGSISTAGRATRAST